MQKLMLILTCALFAAFTVFGGEGPVGPAEADAVILEEHFEQWPSASGPPGWMVALVTQGVLWRSSASCEKGVPNNTGGTGLYADANSDCIGWRFFDSTLISPEFSLADPRYNSAKLVYKTCLLRWVSWYATAEVGITTDGGATLVSLLKYPEQNYDHRTETIDLTPYLGQAHVRIGFRYQTLNVDSYWQVDDVFVVASTGGSACLCAGDANCDGAVNVGDSVQVKRCILGLDSGETCVRSDVNRDGAVNVGDSVQLKRYILGLDSCQ